MLKIRKFFITLQNILLIGFVVSSLSMFYIRYKMYNIMNNLVYLDKKIEKLKNHQNLLEIELTYLISAERILSLIEKNPKILESKEIADVRQLKTKQELKKISLAKAMNKVYENKKIAKNKTIDDLIDSEL